MQLRPLVSSIILCLTTAFLCAVEPVQIVATGGRIAYSFYTPATANTAFSQRTPHVLGGPVDEIQIGFMDWVYPTSSAETPNTVNEVTIAQAWLERASTGQVVPLTFSGARALVLPMNSTTPYWLSDAIPSSAWTGSTLSRDEIFWLHLKGTIPEGGKIPIGTPATWSGAKFMVYPPENDTGGYDYSGTIPTVTGSTTRIEGIPIIFLGRYTEPGHLSVIGIGDSILHGSGDATNPTAVITGYGYLNRAAQDTAGANTIAMFNLTRHGQTAYSLTLSSRSSRQREFLQYANVAVEEYGTNDLGTNGTGDAATILSRVETIWSLCRDAGIQKIIRTNLLPRTTSTDSWATLANQTPNTGWELDGKRDTINAGLEDALSAGKIDILVDTLLCVQDPSDANRWITDGTAKYATGDGTHPDSTGYALIAPTLRSALLSVTVDENASRYSSWADQINWNGADSAADADPNKDGITNLESYAEALSPTSNNAPGLLPSVSYTTDDSDNEWVTFTYRESTTAPDVVFSVQTSTDLNTWTTVSPDGIDIISDIADSNPDGDGSAVLKSIRIKTTQDRLFVRLSVRI